MTEAASQGDAGSGSLGTIVSGSARVDGMVLTDRVLRAAAALDALGLRPNDRIALLMRNSATFVEAVMAAQHLGAYAVPINWHGAPPEIAHVVTDCGASILLGDPELMDRAAPALPEGVRLLRTGAPWDDWRDRHPPIARPALSEVPSMIYTSGTTGRPKGVKRLPATPGEAARIAALRHRVYGVEPGMRLLMPAPLYHAAPNFLSLTAVRRGGLLVLPPRFDAKALLASIEEHRITHLFAVPTMFVRLLALPAELRHRYDLSSLRVVLHSAAACPPHVKRAMIDWLGPIVHEYYGSTEMGAVTLCDSAEWLAHPGSVGRALPPYVVTIQREDGTLAETGEDGEIIVEAPGLADFTYHRDNAKRDAMRRGAGMASGDIGHLDADGYLYVSDRKTDMIVRGGINIYPAEIEAALMEMPVVADCAVLGCADAEMGERVVAVIRPKSGARIARADVMAHLSGRIARFKLPEDIYFQDELPREESGKMFKRRLRDAIMASR